MGPVIPSPFWRGLCSSTIRDSDLIILLKDGTIAEQGTHDELMALNGQYAAMYRTQIGENI